MCALACVCTHTVVDGLLSKDSRRVHEWARIGNSILRPPSSCPLSPPRHCCQRAVHAAAGAADARAPAGHPAQRGADRGVRGGLPRLHCPAEGAARCTSAAGGGRLGVPAKPPPPHRPGGNAGGRGRFTPLWWWLAGKTAACKRLKDQAAREGGGSRCPPPGLCNMFSPDKVRNPWGWKLKRSPFLDFEF